MSDLEPEPREPPPPLEYRSTEDDRKPGEALKVLAFMAGMIVGIVACVFFGGICVAGVASSSTNPSPAFIVLVGCLFFLLGGGSIFFFIKGMRKDRRNPAFLLGLFCGCTIIFLLEGFCFTAIGINS